MKKRVFSVIIFICCLVYFIANALALTLDHDVIAWDSGNIEEYEKIVEIENGFLAIGGSYESNLLEKKNGLAYINQYDNDNNIVNQVTWGLGGNNFFHDAIIDNDGNIVAVGFSTSTNILGTSNPSHYEQAIIVKYDKNLNMIWQKKLNSVNENEYSGKYYSLIEDNDHYVVVGCMRDDPSVKISDKYYDSYVVKYDKDGNITAMKDISTDRYDSLRNVIKQGDSYVFVGRAKMEDGYFDGYVVKLSTSLEILWQKTYGGNLNDLIYKAKADGDSIVCSGYIKSKNIPGITITGETCGWILKLDSNGIVLKQFAINGTEGFTHFVDISLTPDSYIVVGRSSSKIFDSTKINKYYYMPIIAEIDKQDGAIIDSKAYGSSMGAGNLTEIGFNSIVNTSNGLIVSGLGKMSDIDGFIVHFGKQSITTTPTIGGNIVIQKDAAINERVNVAATPDEGYELQSMSVYKADDIDKEVPISNGSFVMPSYDVVVHASFTKKKFNVIATTTTGGTIAPNNALLEYGISQDFTLTLNEGYKLNNIKVNNVDKTALVSNNKLNLIIKEETNVIAQFEKIRFRVEITANAGGNIEPDGSIDVDYGDDLKLKIKCNEGYQIKLLTIDGVDKTSEIVSNVFTMNNVL